MNLELYQPRSINPGLLKVHTTQGFIPFSKTAGSHLAGLGPGGLRLVAGAAGRAAARGPFPGPRYSRARGLWGYAVDGRNPFRTTQETAANIFSWYLKGNHQKPKFLKWCEVDFVHPQLMVVVQLGSK